MHRFTVALFATLAVFIGLSMPGRAEQEKDLAPFALPATFQGVTPCADCPGVRLTITLSADGTYKLERIYLERTAKNDETGTWEYDEDTSLLTLRPNGSKTNPELFAVNLKPTLQMLDAQGKAIQSGANHTLSEMAATAPNEPLRLESGEWRLVDLQGKPINSQDLPQGATLKFDAAQKRVSGSGGCNRLMGPYQVTGAKLHFGPIAATMMACQHGMDTEAAFFHALEGVASYKIDGDTLSLLGPSGATLAKLRIEK
jgi:copper homeostasis protein (lipoprotein)